MRIRFSHMTIPLACLGMCCLILSASLTSCSSVHEARTIVAQADSLWIAGAPCSDSTALASAAATLEPLRLFYPTDYAHANYHYGRLLRDRGDHPAAMQAFLRVTHSRTNDHAIKGRAWSNIANMCRLAAEHELAYDIYEKSADEFIKANDSINYFYVTNGKALELGELLKFRESIAQTYCIEHQCSSPDVLARVYETRAYAFLQATQLDSAIYYARLVQDVGNNEATGCLLMARAFSALGIQDSAVHYAHKVVERTHSWFDLNNAFYILANDDVTKTKSEILQIVGERSDIQKQIEIRQGQLSQAVQLLEQDLNRKPDLRWLYAAIGTSLVIGSVILVSVKRKRRKHQLLSQQIQEKERQQFLLTEQNRSLVQQKSQHSEKVMAEIKIFCENINSENINDLLCWNDYNQMCAIVNLRMYGLADKLKAKNIVLEQEMRLCILVAIGQFNNSEMASLIPYGYNSFKTMKSSIAGRLGFSGRKMRESLLNLAVGD